MVPKSGRIYTLLNGVVCVIEEYQESNLLEKNLTGFESIKTVIIKRNISMTFHCKKITYSCAVSAVVNLVFIASSV